MRNGSAIGMIEMNSIAKGYAVGDAMLKAANVEILFNRTICPGKFMVMVSGDIAAVEAAMDAGLGLGHETVVDELIIPNVHTSVFAAISGTRVIEQTAALGIIETFSVASIIEAADAAVKAANIELIDIHLAMAIGGKGYATMTGDVASVTAAVEAGIAYIKDKGVIVDYVVIPQPREEILRDKV
ncbi:Putative propanediol utilization protein [Oleispira antarctica RB-8]|jgi:microcompartment protein CcmL/EutN|uniref:Putative propanediol utilization protein n=1 Tax=Oleispira antarctica RB-8 TaxID=698738 RepID=R4YSW7_OLEAN|nr:Putative propanediol utilization protein [Oleispira antarctica RB-8]